MNKLLAVVFAFALHALPALAGPYESARTTATKTLKAAVKRVDSAPACAQTQGYNIRDALRRAQAMTPASPAAGYEELRLFLSGVALGGAMSGCPDDLYPLLETAQTALSAMASNVAVAPAPPTYASGDDDDEPAAATGTQGVTADDVTVNPDFVDNTGAPAILFLAKRPQASGLQGKKIVWSLLVKRKTAPWNKAKSFTIGESKVTAPVQVLGDVSISIRYTTFASKGLSPGDYVAALLGNVKTTNVFRDEIPFALAAPSGDDDDYVAPAPGGPPPPAAAGPRAMDDKAFAGFLGAVSNTMMDSAKASMVKSACKKNWFSSAQLGQLLDVFMMEANKFEAAQAAVPRLVDPQNAYGLAEKFMFNANKTAFTALLSE